MKNTNHIKKVTEKRINAIILEIKKDAKDKILKALNSGAISEDSDFLKDNMLLASILIEDSSNNYKIKSKEYREEAENIKRFI